MKNLKERALNIRKRNLLTNNQSSLDNKDTNDDTLNNKEGNFPIIEIKLSDKQVLDKTKYFGENKRFVNVNKNNIEDNIESNNQINTYNPKSTVSVSTKSKTNSTLNAHTKSSLIKRDHSKILSKNNQLIGGNTNLSQEQLALTKLFDKFIKQKDAKNKVFPHNSRKRNNTLSSNNNKVNEDALLKNHIKKISENYFPLVLLNFQVTEANKVVVLLNSAIFNTIYSKFSNSKEEENKQIKRKFEDNKKIDELTKKIDEDIDQIINKANSILNSTNKADNLPKINPTNFINQLNNNNNKPSNKGETKHHQINNKKTYINSKANITNPNKNITENTTTAIISNKRDLSKKINDSSIFHNYMHNISSLKEMLNKTKEKIKIKHIQLKKVSKVLKDNLTNRLNNKSGINSITSNFDINQSNNIVYSAYFFSNSIVEKLINNYYFSKSSICHEEVLSLWIITKVYIKTIDSLNIHKNSINNSIKDFDANTDSCYNNERNVWLNKKTINLIIELIESIQNKTVLSTKNQTLFNNLYLNYINSFSTHLLNDFLSNYERERNKLESSIKNRFLPDKTTLDYLKNNYSIFFLKGLSSFNLSINIENKTNNSMMKFTVK